MNAEAMQTESARLRKDKDQFFRESHHSPIPESERPGFEGLSYLPYNGELIFDVGLKELHDQEEVVMATSVSGEESLYRKAGYFEFEVDGTIHRLHAYRSAHEHEAGRQTLFIPFRDRTSGKETYGAGRYLDLELTPSGRYILDFNLAYNPYCAYSDRYVCPLPPRENWLQVEIRAGEKDYKGRH